MKSVLKEVITNSGVIVEYGDTRIECNDDAEALKKIKELGFVESDIVYPDGTRTTVKQN